MAKMRFGGKVRCGYKLGKTTRPTRIEGTDMAEHKHGSMDTTEQEKTFAGLMKVSAWVVAITFIVLIFLAFVGT